MSAAKKASPGVSVLPQCLFLKKKPGSGIMPGPGFDPSASRALPAGGANGGLDTFHQDVMYPWRAKGLVALIT